MKTSRSQGFTIVEGLLIVVVIAVLGGVGYVAYNSFVLQKSGQQATNTDQKSTSELNTRLQARLDNAKAQPKPELKTPDDLNKAVEKLKDQSAFDTSKESKEMNDMAAKFLN